MLPFSLTLSSIHFVISFIQVSSLLLAIVRTGFRINDIIANVKLGVISIHNLMCMYINTVSSLCVICLKCCNKMSEAVHCGGLNNAHLQISLDHIKDRSNIEVYMRAYLAQK